MIKRRIKPAAGGSKISIEQARSAARVVYRDSRTGRFVIVEGGRGDRKPRRGGERSSGSHGESQR